MSNKVEGETEYNEFLDEPYVDASDPPYPITWEDDYLFVESTPNEVTCTEINSSKPENKPTKRRVCINLAAENSKFEFYHEIVEYYKKQVEDYFVEEKLKEKLKKKYWDNILKNLPTKPRAAIEREKRESREANKLWKEKSAKLRHFRFKARQKEPKRAGGFSRRTGGRSKIVKSDPKNEVIEAAKRARRNLKKKQKKLEEKERQTFFANVTTVVSKSEEVIEPTVYFEEKKMKKKTSSTWQTL